METKKTFSYVVIALVVVAVLAAGWYFYSGGKGSGDKIPESAYPQARQDQPGVESLGVAPPDNRAGPASSLPLEGGGK